MTLGLKPRRARARLLFDIYEKALQVRSYGSLIGKVFKTDTTELGKADLAFENIGREIDRISCVDRSQSGRWAHSGE